MKKLLLLLLLAPMLAFSQTIYVTPTGAGAMNGTSWANAYPGTQLQTAFSTATSEVWVAAGTYLPTYQSGGDVRSKFFYFIGGIKVYGGFPATGSPTMASRNPAVHVTTLSGDIDPVGNNDAYHVFYMRELPSTALLDGFTISGGRADGSNGDQFGGGIYNYSGGFSTDILFGGPRSSNPTINNCIFKNNYAVGGSGIFNDGRFGGIASPTITNCTFMDNTGASGGGIYNTAGLFMSLFGEVGGKSNPTITNCTFTNNVVTNLGGGIYNFADGNLSQSNPIIKQCTFTGNQAFKVGINGAGGAILNDAQNNGTTSGLIENCTFTNNKSIYSGGAITNISRQNNGGTSSPTIRNCSFVGNSAQNHVGGAIFNTAYQTTGDKLGFVHPRIENCVFRSNMAVYGGAVYNYSETNSSCKPKFINCTFNNNSATNFGGTLGNHTAGGTTEVEVKNSIFWGNSGTDKNISIQTVTAFNISYSLLDEAGCPANVTCGAGMKYNQNPLFVDAANGNLRLQTGSPAVDAGDNTANNTSTDLDGSPRKVRVIDMGAYEKPMVVSFAPICLVGNPLKLSTDLPVNAGNQYSWKGPNGFTSSSATPTKAKTVANDEGIYSVTVTTNDMFTITATIRVYYGVGNITATSNSTVCKGGTIQLSATSEFGVSYKWTKQLGSTVYTGQNPTIPNAKVTDGGMYIVFITGANGCIVKKEVLVTVSSVPCVGPRLASEEVQEIGMEVNAYPNPTSNKVTVEIKLREPSTLKLQLFNATGQALSNWDLSDETTMHRHEIDMSAYHEGLYLIQAQSKDSKLTKRVVKVE